jgi:hypothetical protein
MASSQVLPAPAGGGGGGGGCGGAGWCFATVYIAEPDQFFFAAPLLDARLGRHQVFRNGQLLLVGDDNDYIMDGDGVWMLDPVPEGSIVQIFG